MDIEFEAVIGLEIHVQLLTNTKAFSGESAAYGGMPNTQLSVINLAHPGTLPMHNSTAINKAIKLGLALNSNIRRENQYSRKNYFYADLPKGYQITQFDTPICDGGRVKIKTPTGQKEIALTRIHMEEDTGKSMHDQDLTDSLIDYNRAGTPLVEIVTEPDIKNAEEAYAFVTEVRRLVRYLEICDGNMEEGSLRCDANVSVMPKGSNTFGTKVEVKNMNSISNVKRAIEHEIIRQTELVRSGDTVYGETRGFNALEGKTFSMRKKEMVNDYRYFPEPDLPPTQITDAHLKTIRNEMPPLPEELFDKFTQAFGLSDYDAGVLVDEKHIALYFEEIVKHTKNYKSAANWLSVNIKGHLNEHAIDISDFKLEAKTIAEIIELVDKETVSHSAAAKKLFPFLIEDPEASPIEAAKSLGLVQSTDSSLVEKIVAEVLEEYSDKVQAYKSGKRGLLGLFVGECMKRGKGKLNPKMVNQMLNQKLSD
jgi:aspartyl-tRNA(Asn)/glutamyl-tRNA(Gln) amidotransferase subunit B